MKTLALALGLLVTIFRTATAQVVSTNTGKAHFFSEAPLENIEATTKKVLAAFNPATGQISVRVPMSTFVFEKSLMQEHFNDNYLETAKYPNAVLEGKLDKPIDLTRNGVQQAKVVGTLDLHGVKKEYSIPVNITVDKGVVTKALTRFQVKLADHNIEIPKMVIKNLAEEVAVDTEFDLKPAAKK